MTDFSKGSLLGANNRDKVLEESVNKLFMMERKEEVIIGERWKNQILIENEERKKIKI